MMPSHRKNSNNLQSKSGDLFMDDDKIDLPRFFYGQHFLIPVTNQISLLISL